MNITIEKFPQPQGDEIDYQNSAQRAQKLFQVAQCDPLPLERETLPAKPYPFDALRPILGMAAQRTFEVVKAPDGVVGNSFLAASSLAVQGYADVAIDGRSFPSSLFALSVSDSGERKSAVDRIALRPFHTYQRYLYEQYGKEKEVYDMLAEKYKLDRSAAFKSKEPERSKLLSALELPENPREPILFCEEPTWEGLVRCLDVGQSYMGIFADEGSMFAGGYSMSPEKRLKMLGGLSKLWDGMPISNVRKGDPSIIIYDKRLSLHLMMQPVVLQALLTDGPAEGQGWLARCLIVAPEPIAGKRIYDTTNLEEDPQVKAYHDRVNTLLDSKLVVSERQIIILPTNLHNQWLKFYNFVEERLALGGELQEIKATASKAPEQVLRIASTTTLFENPEAKEISKIALEGAIHLMTEYYLPAALSLKGEACKNKEVNKAKMLLKYMQESKKEVFWIGEFYQKGPKCLRDVTSARDAVSLLIKHGYVEKLEKKTTVDDIPRSEVYRLLLC